MERRLPRCSQKPSYGCFEDSNYDVAGIPGFLFLSKEKAWVCT
ncbi:MAG: hypothetical protein ACI4UY_13485 [Kiritimatiellia bacterium]